VLFAGAAAFVLCPRICRETGSRDTIPFPLSCACLNDAASAAAADDDDEGEEDSPPLVFTARVANSGRLTLAEGWKSQTLSAVEARRWVCSRGFIVFSIERTETTADMWVGQWPRYRPCRERDCEEE
jgi:hypothetical protein